jgi:hypothetical protein
MARKSAWKRNKKVALKTASKMHRSSSWHGMDGEFAHRLHLLEDRATSLFLVSCTHRCSEQGCAATFLLRFLSLMPHPGSSSVPVCHMQDGFPDKLPIEELVCHLANLGPWGFHADGRFELARGNQASQMRQPDGGGFLR